MKNKNVLKIKHECEVYKRVGYSTVVNNLKANEGNNKMNPIDCSMGENPFLTQKWIKKITKKVKLEKVVCGYPTEKFFLELKKEIVKKFNINEKYIANVFLGHGAFDLMEKVIHKCVRPGKMLGMAPQFNRIPSEFELAGGEYVSIEFLKNEGFCDQMVAEIESETYDCVYIDNPNNPTGHIFDISTLVRITKACEDTGTICIIDEAYGDFLDEKSSMMQLVPHFQKLIVVRSFSKGYGLAGLRSGYLFTSGKIGRHYNQARSSFEPSTLAVPFSLECLKDKAFIEETRRKTKEIKEYAMAELWKIGFSILKTNPLTPIFVLHKKNKDVFEMFKKKNIHVIPGSSFERTPKHFDNSYVRLRIPKNRKEIDEIIKRISTGHDENNEVIEVRAD